MEDIIQEIIDIEKKASIIMKKAEDMKKDLPNIIKNKSLENIKAINIHTQGILIKLYQDVEKYKEYEINKIKENLEKQIKDINREYNDRKIEWEKNIYNNVISKLK